ncbi:hypothetical protein, partial [Parafrankia irregularis]|uniref:hypothetical protein n=1 Tax=Parafrankia irregularis TaxID=795642 RepID=UPI001A965FF2
MPGDDILHRGIKYADVQFSGQAKRHWHHIPAPRPTQAINHPEGLLSEGCRQVRGPWYFPDLQRWNCRDTRAFDDDPGQARDRGMVEH